MRFTHGNYGVLGFKSPHCSYFYIYHYYFFWGGGGGGIYSFVSLVYLFVFLINIYEPYKMNLLVK